MSGDGAAAAGVASSRILHQGERRAGSVAPNNWVWPLPRLDGVLPAILDENDEAEHATWLGYPPGTSFSDLLPVFAVQDGVISFAGATEAGLTVCIDHRAGWCSHYGNLGLLLAAPTDRFRRRRKARVLAGDVIAYASPPRARVRFDLLQLADGTWRAADPRNHARAWTALPWFCERAPLPTRRRAA